tara:strand:+ start:1210 stop:1539 length:330 start_codon:yes stop_codon:yes gene_type:complete
MSDLKKKYEVMDYLKRNRSKYHYISARKLREEIKIMFDIDWSDYIIRKMMVASDIKINVNRERIKKISVSSESDELSLVDIKDQLNHLEKKIDFVCDFIQYAKTGEVPQ